ncbi:MAG: hypothetical protein ACOY99_03780 [Pseudomonadota bacterium]
MTATNLWQEGYRLCTAEIVYRDPENPDIFGTYVWQELDLAPEFPVLKCFLQAWQAYCAAEVESVQVAPCDGVTPEELKYASISLLVH